MKTEIRRVDPREIKLLDVNARYMRYEQYQRLVANVRRDGVLTSTPLCWVTPTGRLEVLSGNHRVQAAVDAELDEIDAIVCLDDLTEQQRVAIQLSHNSIAGEDDPAVLKDLYDSLGDIDWRGYAGLDDQTLDLLGTVDVASLSEAALDFTTLQVVFLPTELEAARAALDNAAALARPDEQWLARFAQHDQVLDALASVQQSYRIGNIATTLGLVLAVFEAHLTDLADGWQHNGEPTRKGTAPLESVLGTRQVPVDVAAVVRRAVRTVMDRKDADTEVRALELICADFLAGPDPDGVPVEPPARGDVGEAVAPVHFLRDATGFRPGGES